MLNKDYREILQELSAEKVKFLLVGAYAMAVHGYPRATADLDIWVMPSRENAEAVLRALVRFGAPVTGLSVQDLQTEGTVFQIGVAPRRIDILTAATGLQFDEAFKKSVPLDVEGVMASVLSIDDIIRNKKATGRIKDLADVEALEQLKASE
jgi:hypothetical protein